MSDYEAVHTITDWYDGAKNGVADLNGEPHYYENHWNEGEQFWSDIYLLQPLDTETFALAMEDWEFGFVGNALSSKAKQLKKHIQPCQKTDNGTKNLRRF